MSLKLWIIRYEVWPLQTFAGWIKNIRKTAFSHDQESTPESTYQECRGKPFGWRKNKKRRLPCCKGRMGEWYFSGGVAGRGNFESHPNRVVPKLWRAPQSAGYESVLRSSNKVLTRLKFYFCIMQYSCSGSMLCCSAGGWEEEEDADEIWIISSQCLAKPHFAGTAAFQCSSPPTQPGSCRPIIWLLTPHPPPSL